MACTKCDHKGYIEDIFFANDKQNVHIRICPYCNDHEAYSKHIQKTYSANFVSATSSNYAEYVKRNFGKNAIPPAQAPPPQTYPISILGLQPTKQASTPDINSGNVINFVEYKRKNDKRVFPKLPEGHTATILEFKRK